MSYKKITPPNDPNGNPLPEQVIKRTTDGVYIPFDEANIDYQEYLEWVAEGNTAEAAD